jgi:hypothetical protein
MLGDPCGDNPAGRESDNRHLIAEADRDVDGQVPEVSQLLGTELPELWCHPVGQAVVGHPWEQDVVASREQLLCEQGELLWAVCQTVKQHDSLVRLVAVQQST